MSFSVWGRYSALLVLVSTVQLSHHSTEAATDDMWTNEHGCIPIKLYLQKQAVRLIWPAGYSFPIPVCTRWQRADGSRMMERYKENRKGCGSCLVRRDCLKATGTAREQEQDMGLRKAGWTEGLHMEQSSCPHTLATVPHQQLQYCRPPNLICGFSYPQPTSLLEQ